MKSVKSVKNRECAASFTCLGAFGGDCVVEGVCPYRKSEIEYI